MTGLGQDVQQSTVPASHPATTIIEQGLTGGNNDDNNTDHNHNNNNNNNNDSSEHISRRARCCCGRQDCAYLKHNDDALGALERDLETAARLGQVCVD